WRLTSSKTLIFLSLIVTFLFVSCIDSASETAIKDGWKRFERDNYQIDYPKDWELDESGKHGTVIAILSKKENDDDQFRENVNLVIQDLKGKRVSLDKYTDVSLGQVENQMPDSKLLINERITLNNIPCHR